MRRVGVAAIRDKERAAELFKDKQTALSDNEFKQLSEELELFKGHLENFAMKHKEKIKKNAQFRNQFHKMCATVGVDPLVSSKGYWSELLGVGDFYYELAVQIVEICLAASHRTGGYMQLSDLLRIMQRSGGASRRDTSQEDILAAIKKLKTLGSGLELLDLGKGSYVIKSVPGELSLDHNALMVYAKAHNGAVVIQDLCQSLGWDYERARSLLESLLCDGVIWVDSNDSTFFTTSNNWNSPGVSFWFPSLFEIKS